MLIPTVITAIGLFYLIFSLMVEEAGIPETVAYTVIPAAKRVVAILLPLVPVIMAAILVVAHMITHRIVGPFDRIVRELGQSLSGQRKGPIQLRTGDRFLPLVELINKLLEKI